jgi:hypothetical protein
LPLMPAPVMRCCGLMRTKSSPLPSGLSALTSTSSSSFSSSIAELATGCQLRLVAAACHQAVYARVRCKLGLGQDLQLAGLGQPTGQAHHSSLACATRAPPPTIPGLLDAQTGFA